MDTKANAGQYSGTTEINDRDRNCRKGKRGGQQGRAPVCTLHSGKRKWQKGQIHIRVYFPSTTEICFCSDVNSLWSPTWNEHPHIWMVLFIQRIPRYFINYKYECSSCNVPDVLHTQDLVPDSQNLPHFQHTTKYLNIFIRSQFLS